MSSSSLSPFGCGPCCLKPGHLFDGTPKGSLVSIAGVQCYRTGSNSEKAVLYSTDIFGLRADNPKFISDTIAAGGFTVVIPNTLNDAMDPAKPIDFAKFPEWLARNPPEVAATILEKVSQDLQAEGFKSISILGYCYGAKPAFLLHVKSPLKAACFSHPSMLALGDGAKLPKNTSMLINCAESDRVYTAELQADFESGAKLAGINLHVIYYPRTSHGFATRIVDSDKEKGQKDMEAATVNILKFLQLNA